MQGFGSDGTQLKCWHCKKGHMLQPWVSCADGNCDGCGAKVCHGEKVMDCRQCNWYLCQKCHPQVGEMSLWDHLASALDMSSIASDIGNELGAIANVLSCCQAPSREDMEITEIEIKRASKPKGKKAGGFQTVDSFVELPEDAAPSAAVRQGLLEVEQEDLLGLSAEPAPPAQGPAVDALALAVAAPSGPDVDAPVLNVETTTDAAPAAAAVEQEDLLGLSDPPAAAPPAGPATDAVAASPGAAPASWDSTVGSLPPPPPPPGQATGTEAAPPAVGADASMDLLGLDAPPAARRVVEVF